jgi:hypothetical protein
MALSPEEQSQLDALTAKQSQPDDSDFDIEIWDETGAGARVPYSKGRSWLNRFGIDMPEEPPADQAGEGDQAQPVKGAPRGKAAAQRGTVAQGYFGKKSG